MRHKSRAYSALASILLTTTSFISTIHASQIGTSFMKEAPQNISKRERQLIGIIEHHSLSFEIEKFLKDPLLIQTHTYTKYINPNAKSESTRVVLRKKNEDTGKESIVLSSANNRFAIPTPRGAKKRQFVLLRKGPNQNDDEAVSYYSSLIFVRNLYPGDKNEDTFMVDGVESVVEFDIWEHRPRRFFPGWANCDWSILFTCASQKDIQEDADKAAASRRRKRHTLIPAEAADEGVSHRLFKRVPVDDGTTQNLTPIIGAPGFDPSTYNDLYLDMDFHRFDQLYNEAARIAAKGRRRRRRRSLEVLHRVKRGHGGSGKRKKRYWDVWRRVKRGYGGTGGRRKRSLEVLHRVKRMFGGTGSARGSLGGSVKVDAGGSTGAISGIGKGIGQGVVAAKGVGAVAAEGVVSQGSKVSDAAKAKAEAKAQAKAQKKKQKSDLNSQAGAGDGGFGEGEASLSGGGGVPGLGALAGIGSAATKGLGGMVGMGASAASSGLKTAVGLGASAATAGLGAAAGLGEAGFDASVGFDVGGMLDGFDVGSIAGMGANAAAAGLGAATGMGTNAAAAGLGAATGMASGVGGMFKAGAGMAADALGGSAAVGASMGVMFGGAMEAVAKGMGDSMVQAADLKVNSWSVLGRAMIEHTTNHLMKLGIPESFAKLAVVGKRLATSSFSGMFAVKFKFGWRIGIDAAGSAQNGGEHAGKGFDGEDSLPSNDNYQYGLLYNGAENGRYFFLPQGSLVRVTVKVSGGKEFNAWFEPKLTGLDGIFPDDDDAYQKAIGPAVKVLPVEYEQEEVESEPGIKGTLKEGYRFVNDGKKITAVYKPEDDDWEDQVWMPPELAKKEQGRPSKTPKGKKIFYGYLFNGIEDSPHLFLAEGDSLTGVFVPADSSHPDLTDTPHGIFTPTHPAGHAIFVADDPRETKDFNEVRGVFLPDAMDLSGGISGKLGKWEECNCDIKFSFVLDRPGVDYMYIDGEVQKNIWSPYIDPDKWQFEPQNPNADEDDDEATEAGTPEEDEEDEVPDRLPDKKGGKGKAKKVKQDADKKDKGDPDKKDKGDADKKDKGDADKKDKGDAAKKGKDDEGDEEEGELSKEETKKIRYPGAKIKTKHSLSFIPEDFKMVGGITPVDLKKKMAYKGMLIDMIMTSPDDPWEFNVTKKDDSADKLPDGLAGLFVPISFPKGDALVGKLILDAGQMNGKYMIKGVLPVEAHLWVATDEMWVPVGFKEKQTAEAKAEKNKEPKKVQEEKAAKAEIKAKKNAEEKKAEKEQNQEKKHVQKQKKDKEKQDEIKKAGHKPKKKKEAKAASEVPGSEGEFPPRHNSNMVAGKRRQKAVDDPELNDQIEEDWNEEADEYIHGFYVKTSKSPEPVFVPDTGTQGVFVTDDKKEAKSWYFPKRDKLESALVVDSGSKVDANAKGKFYSVNSTNQKSLGYFEATYKDMDLKADDIEMVPGWEMRDEEAISKEDLNSEEVKVGDEHFKPSQRGEKYALVDIGGGFQGVIVGGGNALDDPNNPLFQEFLHFRMTRDGDVNPWARVAIVDPIQREKVDGAEQDDDDSVFGANMTLGKGRFIENNLTAALMAGFSLSNWDQPEMAEYMGGDKVEPVTLGKKTNVVNMMDFRMFLYKKYSCKRAEVKGDDVVLIAPRAANGFVNLTTHARPREEWLEAVTDAGVTIIFPEEEAVPGKFSATYELEAEDVAKYERPVGSGKQNGTASNGNGTASNGSGTASNGKPKATANNGKRNATARNGKRNSTASNGTKDTGDWKTSAPFEDWGDENACDEIALDEMQASQAIAAMQDSKDDKTSNGITLGYKLVHGRGNRLKFHKIAKKFLKNYERKSEEGEEGLKEAEVEGGSTTDLMGGSSKQADNRANQKAEAKKKEDAGVGAAGAGPSAGSVIAKRFQGKKKAQGKGSGSANGEASGKGEVSGGGKFSFQGRTFGAEEPEPDVREHAKVLPGWRTQHRDMTQNSTLSDNGIMFYGLGNCQYREIPDIDLLLSKKLDKVIKYYLKVLRIECMNNVEDKIIDLINQGFLKLVKDSNFGYFKIPEDNKLIKANRITPAELKRISLAWEFHAVTRTYATMREREFLTTGYYKEPYCEVSRTGLYITELTHYTVAFARKTTPTHGVRMNRNMLTTLRTLMTKLQQDWLKLNEECKNCDFDVRLTVGDKYRVMSLMQFIIYGLGPYHYGEKYPRAAFNQFVQLNNVAITERVKEFARQYALKTQGRI